MELLFSWEVTSVVVGIAIAIGLGVLALDDFRLAKTFFLLATADALGGVVMWGIKIPFPHWGKLTFVFLLTGTIGVLGFLSLGYVDRKEEAKKELKQRTEPQTIQSIATLEVKPEEKPLIAKSTENAKLKGEQLKQHREQEPAIEAAARIAEERELPSADSDLPFGLEITPVANRDITPVALELQFSGEVGKFMATQPTGLYQEQQGGIVVERPDTVLMQRKSPGFTPQQPIIVWVYSKSKISTKKLRSIPFNFPYPEGYLR
jgi:hypothetical protein